MRSFAYYQYKLNYSYPWGSYCWWCIDLLTLTLWKH